jgi:PKD domain
LQFPLFLPSPLAVANSTATSTSVPTSQLLYDNFTQDSTLNTKLWMVNGPIGDSLANRISDTALRVVSPQLDFTTFSTNGMGVSGANSAYDMITIQDNQSFNPPFIARAQVMAAASHGNSFSFIVTTFDGRHGAMLNGNVNASNAGYYGIWEGYSRVADQAWTPLAVPIIATPSANIWYTLTIDVNSSGYAKVYVEAEGRVFPDAPPQFIGTGPFYVLMAQTEGAPYSTGVNKAYWGWVSVSAYQDNTPIVTCGAPTIFINDSSISEQSVTVNGVTQPGGSNCSISSITWSWGDGQSSTDFFPATHTYSEGGTYPITVTAHQSDGQTAESSSSVTVKQPPLIAQSTLVVVALVLALIGFAVFAYWWNRGPAGPGGPGTLPTTLPQEQWKILMKTAANLFILHEEEQVHWRYTSLVMATELLVGLIKGLDDCIYEDPEGGKWYSASNYVNDKVPLLEDSEIKFGVTLPTMSRELNEYIYVEKRWVETREFEDNRHQKQPCYRLDKKRFKKKESEFLKRLNSRMSK